jgi:hypothetical protein
MARRQFFAGNAVARSPVRWRSRRRPFGVLVKGFHGTSCSMTGWVATCSNAVLSPSI